MISIKNFTKDYDGFKAVDNISFEAKEGEVLAILGPNGAGKSTTLKTITGLLKPSRGKLKILGLNWGDIKIKHKLGYMPEESSIYEDMNVYDYLNFFAELYKIKPDVAKQRIDYLLKSLNLVVDKKKVIGNMSKGMKRKVLIARSLINNPKLLVYDEPASGLDPYTTNFILNYILDLKKRGKMILITAHNMNHIERIADRVIIMNHGKIILDDKLENIREKYGKNYSIKYIKSGIIKIENFKSSKELNSFIKKLVENKLEIIDINSEQKSLEEIFIKITN